MAKTYSYDAKCEELARHFLPPTVTDFMASELAQYIQDAIEAELRRLEEENTGTASDYEAGFIEAVNAALDTF